jgi:hypothetical protein
MNKALIIALAFIYSTNGLAQVFGPQQILIDDLTSVQNITAADITGNGYMDILATGFFETRIMLFENSENGFVNDEIITNVLNPKAITTLDINDDGLIDIVYSVSSTNSLEYILNNGDGTYSDPVVIGTLILNIFDLKTVDIDGDNDNDVLLASSGVATRWFELENGIFIEEHIISGPAGRSVEAADIDNDGDIDLVSSSSGSITCVWYENLGDGVYSPPITIRGAGQASSSVFISDLNGDANPDVLVTINSDDTVLWFENMGDGTFGNENIISTSVEFAREVIAFDLDNDGDNDAVSGGGGQLNNLVWFENTDGNGTFGDQIIITEEVNAPFSITSIDLDNDGDLDLACASRNLSTVAWYENLTILGVDGPKKVAFTVYPNPSSDYFTVQATPAGAKGFTLYNLQGKKLKTYPPNTNTIDATAFKTGVYILELITTKGEKLYQKLIRQ